MVKSHELFYREIPLEACHYSFAIVNDRGLLTLNKYNMSEFHVRFYFLNKMVTIQCTGVNSICYRAYVCIASLDWEQEKAKINFCLASPSFSREEPHIHN